MNIKIIAVGDVCGEPGLTCLEKTLKNYKKENNISLGMFGLILLQQSFGFTYTYINNYLSSNSVTLSTFVSPISLIFITVTAFLLRKKKKPSIKNIIGIVLAGIGICLIKLF